MELSEVLKNVTYVASRVCGDQEIKLYRLHTRLYEVCYDTSAKKISSVNRIMWHEARNTYKEHELLLSPN